MDSKCITDKKQFKMFDIIKDTNLWSQSCSHNNNLCFFNRTFNYVCYQRISCCKKHGAVHLVTQGKILIFVTLVQLQMVSDFSKTTKCSPMGFCTFVGL